MQEQYSESQLQTMANQHKSVSEVAFEANKKRLSEREFQKRQQKIQFAHRKQEQQKHLARMTESIKNLEQMEIIYKHVGGVLKKINKKKKMYKLEIIKYLQQMGEKQTSYGQKRYILQKKLRRKVKKESDKKDECSNILQEMGEDTSYEDMASKMIEACKGVQYEVDVLVIKVIKSNDDDIIREMTPQDFEDEVKSIVNF